MMNMNQSIDMQLAIVCTQTEQSFCYSKFTHLFSLLLIVQWNGRFRHKQDCKRSGEEKFEKTTFSVNNKGILNPDGSVATVFYFD